MNGLECDITFMLRYPYLFTAITVVAIPCITLLAHHLFKTLEAILSDLSKEDAK